MKKEACIILAGGLGTRLSSVVSDRPKCLAPVGSRPFIEIQMKTLAERGISRFILSLGHQADLVRAVAEALRNVHEVDSVVEPDRLGTGGGLLYAMHKCGLQEALATNGDTYVDGSLSALLSPLDLAVGELMRMATIHVEDRGRFGGLALQGSQVTGFLEKGAPGAGPINAGVYRIHRSIFDGYKPGEAFSLEIDVMPKLVQQRALYAARLDGSFIDIGIPDDYFRFCSEHGHD